MDRYIFWHDEVDRLKEAGYYDTSKGLDQPFLSLKFLNEPDSSILNPKINDFLVQDVMGKLHDFMIEKFANPTAKTMERVVENESSQPQTALTSLVPQKKVSKRDSQINFAI